MCGSLLFSINIRNFGKAYIYADDTFKSMDLPVSILTYKRFEFSVNFNIIFIILIIVIILKFSVTSVILSYENGISFEAEFYHIYIIIN